MSRSILEKLAKKLRERARYAGPCYEEEDHTKRAVAYAQQQVYLDIAELLEETLAETGTSS